MASVLLTGSRGLVGSAVASRLAQERWKVRAFDVETGGDLRDEAAVFAAAEGCDAIVHAGAIAHDSRGTPAEIVATNVLGTWHVLSAAERRGVGRVIYFSSAQVFGFAEGEGVPAYLPVDDNHPLRAARPYGMSKRLTEEMCEAWTSRTGIPTVVLRPVMILTDETLSRTDPSSAELGAYVHLDDVVEAVALSLAIDVPPHSRLTLCGPGDFDTSSAASVLGWRAMRGWPETA
ncbi:MAG TPA: NAD(P)-dependent oxidoreductase [Acidimicrobiales bacterium]|nr:NAD(P)-dependent oxidoreductase [Acidimicrobiales bacterium]